MAKFRFNLETLLDQRRRVEEGKQRDLAAIERERLEIERQILDAQRDIAAQKQDLRAALAPVKGRPEVDLRSVRLQSHASLHSVASLQRLAIKLAGAHQRAERARAELLRATADRKAVELLKQRRFDAWLREENKKEAAAVDDMVNARVARERATNAEDAA
jgi:flagellar FliJ protein